jgi:hypothetical protein
VATEKVMEKRRQKKDPGDYTILMEINNFFSSLMQNYVFDMGFCVKGSKPEHLVNCWCPWCIF